MAKKASALKRFRIVLVFLFIITGGVAVVNWWLPSLLKKPQVTRLPPGAKPKGGPETGTEALPIAVRTFKASRIEFTDFLPTLGTVRGDSEVALKFETNGVVKSILFREGDLVTKDQVLATLDDQEAKMRLEYAESKVQAAVAQKDLMAKRLSINEQLYQLGAIIQPKLEESQLELKQAEAQLDTAQKEADLAKMELTKMVLKSPMEGVMGTREVDVGEYFTPQSPPMVVGTLLKVSSVYVELGIIERDIERIRMGQRVKVTVDSLPNTTFEGTIDNLAPMVEGKSRTLTAKVKVENTEGKLLPGMFARAEIAVFEKPNALVVPTGALKDTDGDGKFESVFTVEGEVAKLKPITLGYLTTDYAEISNGLAEGEQVVTEARGALKEGSKVTLLETEEAGVQRAEPKLPSPSAKPTEEEGQ
ncbi:MAG: efflux RND transporter periplasmic adaptor subunit [Candidatus Omnitrophica bacterium]|nr:efflux RND transporter periplasmic adaptor subunit [Candidatus Omnitrophota bacterium]